MLHFCTGFRLVEQRFTQDRSLDKRTNIEPNGMRLGLLITVTVSALAAAGIASPLAKRLTGPQGIDVSNWQKTIDWAKVKSQGVAFAYIKATEGTGTACFNFMKPDTPPFAPVTVPEEV
jgi:hypothetical protein